MKKNNNNLSSIFHKKFNILMKLTGNNVSKAALLDYILMHWQKSSYRLKGSEEKWFMEEYADLAERFGKSKRTIESYISFFKEEGLIETQLSRYAKNKNGIFHIQNGAYIKPTTKLLIELQSEPTQQNVNNHPKSNQKETIEKENLNKSPTSCENLEKNCGFETEKNAVSIYKDLDNNSFSNIIIRKKTNLDVDNSYARRKHYFQTIQSFFEKEIKEEIPEAIKKLCLGTFNKLLFEHKKEFSEQVAAEYLFALLNTEYYMPWTNDMVYRNNILAKKLKLNAWRTPKGFYKHFYLGQAFKDKQSLREERDAKNKENEIKNIHTYPIDDSDRHSFDEVIQDPRIKAIEDKIEKKVYIIENLKKSIYTQSSEEIVLQIREKISQANQELEILWAEQSLIEETIENECLMHELGICA